METDAENKKLMHVLIIGAGVTGLAIAHGLQKAGIIHTVFDAEPSVSSRTREWTMGLHWALSLLTSLLPAELAEKIHETYVDPSLDWSQPPLDRMRMYNGLTGEIMKDIAVKGKIVRVSRRKLREFLAQGVDVKYGHSLTKIHYNNEGNTITATFANGVTETGTLLIGADGPRSCVRSLLLGEEAAAATPLENIVHTNFTYCPGDAKKALFLRSAHPAWSLCLNPEMFMLLSIQDTPSPTSPETWSFQLLSGWIGVRSSYPDPASRTAELRRRSALLCEPFASAAKWLPEDVEVRFDELGCWEREEGYDTRGGKIVLAGDAGHAMPPHRGQGLNHAIEDAYNLVALLTSHCSTAPSTSGPETTTATNLSSKLQAYANEASARGAEEVRLSKQNASMVLDWKVLEQSPVFKHALDKSPDVGRKTEHV